MTPKEEMIIICSMEGAKQKELREYVVKTLQEFLREAEKEDLYILNYDKSKEYDYPGLLMGVEIVLILGAFGSKFYDTSEQPF